MLQVGGHPFLYADQFYNEEEFETLFDLRLWRVVRDKYSATGAFPSLWDKVSLLGVQRGVVLSCCGGAVRATLLLHVPIREY